MITWYKSYDNVVCATWWYNLGGVYYGDMILVLQHAISTALWPDVESTVCFHDVWTYPIVTWCMCDYMLWRNVWCKGSAPYGDMMQEISHGVVM